MTNFRAGSTQSQPTCSLMSRRLTRLPSVTLSKNSSTNQTNNKDNEAADVYREAASAAYKNMFTSVSKHYSLQQLNLMTSSKTTTWSSIVSKTTKSTKSTASHQSPITPHSMAHPSNIFTPNQGYQSSSKISSLTTEVESLRKEIKTLRETQVDVTGLKQEIHTLRDIILSFHTTQEQFKSLIAQLSPLHTAHPPQQFQKTIPVTSQKKNLMISHLQWKLKRTAPLIPSKGHTLNWLKTSSLLSFLLIKTRVP